VHQDGANFVITATVTTVHLIMASVVQENIFGTWSDANQTIPWTSHAILTRVGLGARIEGTTGQRLRNVAATARRIGTRDDHAVAAETRAGRYLSLTAVIVIRYIVVWTLNLDHSKLRGILHI